MTFNTHTKAPPAPTYDAQVLFVTTIRCLNCGAINTTSQLFGCDPLAHGNGKHMFPAAQFIDHLPLQKIPYETRLTPVCHLCVDSLQPGINREEESIRWQETLARKREQLKAEQRAIRVATSPTAPKPKKPEPTLDDLI